MVGLGTLWSLAKKVETLLELEATHGRAINDLQLALTAIERRLRDVEHRCDMILVEAKSAARAGAQDTMHGTIADVSRRITLLEVAVAQPRLDRRE